jgi:hypothetical protein
MGEPEDPAVQGADRAFEGPPSEEKETAWVGPTVAGENAEEGEHREGRAGPTATTDDDPEDVGESTRRSAEDIADSEGEEERPAEGTQGPADRPYGTTEPEGASGVDPQGPVTDGPNLPHP